MAQRRCAGGLLAVGIAGFYAGGVVLFFVSDRFRLPLLPFLCVAAGVCGAVRIKPLLTGVKLAVLGVVAAASALVTFSRAWDVYDLSPAIQDYVLLSSASGKAGEDMAGLYWARQGLLIAPENPDALACAVTSFYNSMLQGNWPGKEYPEENWAMQTARVARISKLAPGVNLVGAVALWKIGQIMKATEILHSLAHPPAGRNRNQDMVADDAIGILLLTRLDTPEDDQLAQARVKETDSFYLLVAMLRRDTPEHAMLPANRRDAALQAAPFVKNIFP
jgi:hypothetical protein